MGNSTLKLVTLNAWGGRAADKLIPFFAEKGKDIDVFCLQEMFDADQKALDVRHPGENLRGDVFKRALEVLPDHFGCLAYFDDNRDRMSLAVFVRRGIAVRTIADFIVHRPETPQESGSAVRSSRKLQYLTLDLGGRTFTIANFHGLWNGGPKTDTPERITQANEVRTFLSGIVGPKLLCGDFNLLPDTESIRIMGEGMRNLVTESGVGSTRTVLYRHHDDPAEPKFADYVLASPDVDVKRFEVLPDVVSDHAPLFAEFA